ncbi:MAG: hypothetical protein GJ680_12765 [Alteromonadaceae bacterium]|nr:hypothetical protein [Alteromonadaceae bacterium]
MNSEQQFLELVANLVPRVNKMLAEQNYMLPIGLTCDCDKNVEAVIATTEISDQIQELVNFVQTELKAKSGEVEATCLAYPDYENLQIVCLLENKENYCAKYLIPVNTDSTPVLMSDDIEVEESFVYIFPLLEES